MKGQRLGYVRVSTLEIQIFRAESDRFIKCLCV